MTTKPTKTQTTRGSRKVTKLTYKAAPKRTSVKRGRLEINTFRRGNVTTVEYVSPAEKKKKSITKNIGFAEKYFIVSDKYGKIAFIKKTRDKSVGIVTSIKEQKTYTPEGMKRYNCFFAYRNSHYLKNYYTIGDEKEVSKKEFYTKLKKRLSFFEKYGEVDTKHTLKCFEKYLDDITKEITKGDRCNFIVFISKNNDKNHFVRI